MKFIAHNHYNNNSYLPGDFRSPSGSPSFGEAGVNVTSVGIVSFLLHQSFSDEEKIKVLKALDQELRNEFSAGISAVTSAKSDCSEHPADFFKAAKEINPAITTIYAGKWPQDPGADVTILNTSPTKLAPEVIKAVNPSEADKQPPAEGWKAYETRVRSVFARAQKAANIQRPYF